MTTPDFHAMTTADLHHWVTRTARDWEALPAALAEWASRPGMSFGKAAEALGWHKSTACRRAARAARRARR